MITETTPTITLTLPSDIDLSTASKVIVTFKQRLVRISKDLTDGVTLDSGHELSVYLEQADTALFDEGHPVEVQVNWTQGSNRFASKKGHIYVTENLLREAIE